jgi:hypothetical protein
MFNARNITVNTHCAFVGQTYYNLKNVRHVHPDIFCFLTIRPTRCTNFSNYFGMKLYMFRTVPLSIISSYSLYTQQWYMSYRFVYNIRAESGWNILILLLDSCLQTCVSYTIAECTVNNSWWWTEELSETCRVSFPKKIKKLVHLVGFIIRKFVTLQGRFIKLKCSPSPPGWNATPMFCIKKKNKIASKPPFRFQSRVSVFHIK